MKPLPCGFTVRLRHDLLETGDVLVGGSPLTAMRLSPDARKLLESRTLTVTDRSTDRFARRLLDANLAYPDLNGMALPSADEVTVVIPVRDRPLQLHRALVALAGLQCVVVDDASRYPAATQEVCDRHGATCLPLDQNAGPAAARNHGLVHVTTPYVGFVDSDVQVTASDLLKLARHFADPMVGLVGPRVVGRSCSERPRWFERYDEAASSLTLGTTPSDVRPGATVAWLPGACLIGRVAVLGDGFDSRLRVGEDVDLVWRLVEKGQGVRYEPAVSAYHDARVTIRGWLGRKFVYGMGGAPLATRHGGHIAPAVLAPRYAAAAAALLLRNRWSPLIVAAAVALGFREVRTALTDTPDRHAIAAQVAVRGLGWAVRQEAGLAVRHWWPATFLVSVKSKRARRMLATALAVDSVIALRKGPRNLKPSEALLVLVGQRLSDLAYGAGLWCGAIKHHSIRVLLPRRPHS